jgi:hypothetical protein
MIRTCAAILLPLAASSCGYTMGSGLQEQGVQTVFMRFVGNETYRQRLEVDLSRALARELPVSAGLQPATEAEADAVLEVEIAEERERTLVPGSRLDPVREDAWEVLVKVRLRRRADGSILVQRELAERAEFRSPIGEDLTSAQKDLVRDLARKIALSLEGAF